MCGHPDAFLDDGVVRSVEVLQKGKQNCLWFAEKRPCICLESDFQMVILEATEICLEKVQDFRTELLACLTERLIGLTLLQDGMHIILVGVVSRL